MPEVQKGDDVENQDHEDDRKDRDGAKPREHERAVAGPRRRGGNTDNVVESSEELCERFDHIAASRLLEQQQRLPGRITSPELLIDFYEARSRRFLSGLTQG